MWKLCPDFQSQKCSFPLSEPETSTLSSLMAMVLTMELLPDMLCRNLVAERTQRWKSGDLGSASERLQGGPRCAQAAHALLWRPEARRAQAGGRLEPQVAAPAAAKTARVTTPRNLPSGHFHFFILSAEALAKVYSVG